MYRMMVVISLIFLSLPSGKTIAAQAEDYPFLREYCSVVRVGAQKSSFGSIAPIIFKDRLQINESPTYRTAIRKDQQSGISDLKNLCKNAFLEEYWGFFPYEKLWIEMSFNEKIDSTAIDFNYLKEAVKKKDDICIYHIHLRNYLKSIDGEGYGKIPESWLVLPSFEDIALMVYFSSLFYHFHPHGNISWYICSPLGITEYLLSDKGINHFRKIEQDTFFLEYVSPTRSNVMNPKSLSISDLSVFHNVHDLMEWANIPGKGYLEIRFFLYSAPTISVSSLGPK